MTPLFFHIVDTELNNTVGIIDSDYYGNESNDGHFMYAYYNFFDHDVEIKKGDIIGQVVFQKYLVVDSSGEIKLEVADKEEIKEIYNENFVFIKDKKSP